MPLDAMNASVLDRLGLIPVPDEVLAQHKESVVWEFRRNRHLYPPQAAASARWFEFCDNGSRFYNDGIDRGVAPGNALAMIEQMTQGIGVTATTPPAVTQIVADAERRARDIGIETERVAGFFYTDPYVCLVYREAGKVKRACLAIWDGAKVLHLAKLV
jgi:hypothetical protein